MDREPETMTNLPKADAAAERILTDGGGDVVRVADMQTLVDSRIVARAYRALRAEMAEAERRIIAKLPGAIDEHFAAHPSPARQQGEARMRRLKDMSKAELEALPEVPYAERCWPNMNDPVEPDDPGVWMDSKGRYWGFQLWNGDWAKVPISIEDRRRW